jgi:formylglycine-generating enzyme required for sulfatase activity
LCRGGTWYNDFFYCRASRRGSRTPGDGGTDMGFRAARNP